MGVPGDGNTEIGGVREADASGSLLLRYKADMLAPFRVVGNFWDADTDSYGPSAGVLSWNPGNGSCLSVLPDGTRGGIADILASQGETACLHGKWLANIDGDEMIASYMSVEAVTAGGYEGYGPYRHCERQYAVNSVWAGDRTVKPSKSVFSQMAFSFRGLDRWADLKPDVPTRDYKGRRVVAGSEWDVLLNMNISDVGDAVLFGGYAVSGAHGKHETLSMSHVWRVDFCSPKTWEACQRILEGFAEMLSDAAGVVPDLRTLTLAEKSGGSSDGDIFAVRVAQNPGSPACHNAVSEYQGPRMPPREAKERKLGNLIADRISQ